jgi:serine/threonine protein kinase
MRTASHENETGLAASNYKIDFSKLAPVDMGKKKLGSGAYASVKLVKDSTTGLLYALKEVILTHQIDLKVVSKSDMVNIEREITFHQKIDHPNIIRFYDYQKNDEQKKVLIALEYAENGDLFNYLNKKGALEEKIASKFFVQTALALNYIHQFKMIHRDVKPENILLDKQLNAKLCDFGWSAEYDENTKRQTICGTYEYMAPEIIFKKQQDTSIDVWSLGILLYELLHNKAPYSGRSMMEVSKKIASKQIDFHPEVPQDAKELILNILKTNPKDRLCIREILQSPFVRRTYGMLDESVFRVSEKRVSETHSNSGRVDTQPSQPSTTPQSFQNNVKFNFNTSFDSNVAKSLQAEKPKPATNSNLITSNSNSHNPCIKRPPLGPQMVNFHKSTMNQSQQEGQPGPSQQQPMNRSGEQKAPLVYTSQSRPHESSQRQLPPAIFTFDKPRDHQNGQNQPLQSPAPEKMSQNTQNGTLNNGQQGQRPNYTPQAKVIINLGQQATLTDKQIQKENGGNQFPHYSQGPAPTQIDKKALQPVDYNAPPARQMQVIEDSKSIANLRLNTLRLKKVISDQPYMRPPVTTKDNGLKSFMGVPSMAQNQTVERVNSSFGGPADSYRSIRKQNSLDVNKVVVQQVPAPANFYRPLGGHNTPITR